MAGGIQEQSQVAEQNNNSGANQDTEFQLIGFPRVVDTAGLRSREPFEVLVSQFVEELRQGQQPSIELYARRFPPHAANIRECFPVLQLLEQARIEKESASFRHNMPERFPFSTLGQCELLCELGRGGMGVVFQARDLQSGHIVAIKVLPWRVAIVPEWQQRFEREARIAAQLRHRNIVPVFRFGLEHGYCYYVMQFVNGIGLDHIINRLRITEGVICQEELRLMEQSRPPGFVAPPDRSEAADPREAGLSRPAAARGPNSAAAAEHRRLILSRSSWQSFARIAIQAAQALRCAHAAGILHNDIKPGNLLLDIDGRVWVTDFGLSQVMESAGQPSLGGAAPLLSNSERALLRSGADPRTSGVAGMPRLAGTLRYMAPERLSGDPTDARSDLYSLGATLYELVLLQPAFAETDRELLIQSVLDRPPVAPRAVRRDVPKDLETIILNCLARDPEQRYASAEQLLTDLLRFCSGNRVESTRPGAVSGFLRSFGRRRRGPAPG